MHILHLSNECIYEILKRINNDKDRQNLVVAIGVESFFNTPGSNGFSILEMLNFEPCENCGQETLLIDEPACASQAVHGYCCTKRVCRGGCRVACSKNHKNVAHSDNGELKPFNCVQCGENIVPKYKWHDLGYDEYCRRYGY